MQLLLASSSRYRRELLARLGIGFDCASPDIDESAQPGEAAPELVARLATAKAQALRPQYPTHLIIGSDQVAVCGAQILGKPGSAARAEQQLQQLSGRTVRFYTGLTLLNSATGAVQNALDTTAVTFRDLSHDEITAYVRREQPLDCAGAFKSEGLGVALFESIETRDPAALIGLPLVALCAMLRREQANPLLALL